MGHLDTREEISNLERGILVNCRMVEKKNYKMTIQKERGIEEDFDCNETMRSSGVKHLQAKVMEKKKKNRLNYNSSEIPSLACSIYFIFNH